jgi:hypothetical protein
VDHADVAAGDAPDGGDVKSVKSVRSKVSPRPGEDEGELVCAIREVSGGRT